MKRFFTEIGRQEQQGRSVDYTRALWDAKRAVRRESPTRYWAQYQPRGPSCNECGRMLPSPGT